MGSREFRVVLRTKTFEDYETTVAFYRDGLELPVIASWDRDRDRGTLLRAASGIIEVLATAPGMEFSLVDEGPPRGVTIAIEVEDVDSYFRRIRDKGVAIRTEPEDQSWNHRTFTLTDPLGVVVYVFSASSAA